MDSRAKQVAPVMVLCADDVARQTVAYWLHSSGIAAAVALTGYEARALLGVATRLLITDRVLPPWPGLDTFVALKLTVAGLKVAVLDDGVPDNRTLARSAGADIVLERPLRRADVIAACRVAGNVPGDVACVS